MQSETAFGKRLKKNFLAWTSALAIALTFASSAAVESTAFAYDPEALAWLNQGEDAYATGDFDLAARSFQEASKIALRVRDWESLIDLTIDYLLMSGSDASHANDHLAQAKLVFSSATAYGYDHGFYSPDRPGSGDDCDEAQAALESVLFAFDAIIGALLDDVDYETFVAQRNIAQNALDTIYDTGCVLDPAITGGGAPGGGGVPGGGGAPGGGGGPTGAPVPAPSPWDQPFTPRYLLHSTGHETLSGPVQDDFYFLFTQAPVNGDVLIPDGTGGTFTYHVDSASGPYTTRRQVCAALAGQGPNYQSVQDFAGDHDFDCRQLPP